MFSFIESNVSYHITSRWTFLLYEYPRVIFQQGFVNSLHLPSLNIFISPWLLNDSLMDIDSSWQLFSSVLWRWCHLFCVLHCCWQIYQKATVVPLISFSFWWILRSPLGFWPSVVHYEVSSCEFIFFIFPIIFCESWNVGSHLTISKNSAHHFFPLLFTFLILSFLLNILLNMCVPSAAHLHVCHYLLFFISVIHSE